jgi:predicted DNA-binding transcriptional regulator YafY
MRNLRVDPSVRLLRLLTMLSARAFWRSDELAERLEVDERTIRRDINRLRDLGYLVDATPGRHGGYTLGRGRRLPPLVFDDEEAIALVLGLRAMAGGGTSNEVGPALTALTKLDQVLPTGVRERVEAVRSVTTAVRRRDLPWVDVETLTAIALHCRRTERLRFTYTDAGERITRRLVEPYRVVHTDSSWYLVAFDTERDDWRTFRVDRIDELSSTGQRFAPHPEPPDAATQVAEGIALRAYDTQARVRLHAPYDAAIRMIPRTIAVLEPESDATTIADIGGDPDWIARYLAGLDCGFDVITPNELRTELRRLARHLHRAAAS